MGICNFCNKGQLVNYEESPDTDNYDMAYDIKSGVAVIYIDGESKNSTRALNLLTSVNVKPIILDIPASNKSGAMKKSLKKFTGSSSAPYLFISGEYFGGINDIEKGIKNHMIQKKVNAKLESIGNKLA